MTLITPKIPHCPYPVLTPLEFLVALVLADSWLLPFLYVTPLEIELSTALSPNTFVIALVPYAVSLEISNNRIYY